MGTIMYEIYKEKELEIAPNIAGLLCAAIISDTLMFRRRCKCFDKAAAEALADIAGISIPEFASEMFRAGSNLKDKSPEEIFTRISKKFIMGDVTFGVGQITSPDAGGWNPSRNSFFADGKRVAEKHVASRMVFFMLTNIIEESTEPVLWKPAKEVIEKSF